MNTPIVGAGLVDLLGVAFVVLKLTGFITWSWWLVTLPFWGPLALGIAIGLIVLLVLSIIWAIAAWRRA